MPRSDKLYLEEILVSITKIESWIKNITYEEFLGNPILIDAVIRNLEVIGEAAKNISPYIKKRYEYVEWKKLSGLRDVLIHQYFGVDLKLIWNIVTDKLPKSKAQIERIINDLKA